ncbi:MAG: MIP family channel protein [Eubacteriales bacterium]
MFKGGIPIKKYLAELFGTFVLVFFGCGTAVVCGGFTGGTGDGFLGVAAIALAFGLAIVAAAYAIGHVSGCHVNPAVSLAVLISGKMSLTDFIGYVIAQVVGALAGSALISFVVSSSDTLEGFGANGYGTLSGVGLNMTGAIAVEIILTFVFVMTILGVTSSKATSSLAGIVIGLTLTFVHIIGIPLTGTSVNPARGLAPAIFAGGDALSQVWVFILAPLVGAVLAAVVFKYLFPVKENT